jgi:hypothetical protein
VNRYLNRVNRRKTSSTVRNRIHHGNPSGRTAWCETAHKATTGDAAPPLDGPHRTWFWRFFLVCPLYISFILDTIPWVFLKLHLAPPIDVDILNPVHTLPLCISNPQNLSFSTCWDSFYLFIPHYWPRLLVWLAWPHVATHMHTSTFRHMAGCN